MSSSTDSEVEELLQRLTDARKERRHRFKRWIDAQLDEQDAAYNLSLVCAEIGYLIDSIREKRHAQDDDPTSVES